MSRDERLLVVAGELNELGFVRYISSGWNMAEVLYIVAVSMLMNSVNKYMDAERLFLGQYTSTDTQELFNDPLPLRSRYKEVNKFVGLAVFISVIKSKHTSNPTTTSFPGRVLRGCLCVFSLQICQDVSQHDSTLDNHRQSEMAVVRL